MATKKRKPKPKALPDNTIRMEEVGIEPETTEEILVPEGHPPSSSSTPLISSTTSTISDPQPITSPRPSEQEVFIQNTAPEPLNGKSQEQEKSADNAAEEPMEKGQFLRISVRREDFSDLCLLRAFPEEVVPDLFRRAVEALKTMKRPGEAVTKPKEGSDDDPF